MFGAIFYNLYVYLAIVGVVLLCGVIVTRVVIRRCGGYPVQTLCRTGAGSWMVKSSPMGDNTGCKRNVEAALRRSLACENGEHTVLLHISFLSDGRGSMLCLSLRPWLVVGQPVWIFRNHYSFRVVISLRCWSIGAFSVGRGSTLQLTLRLWLVVGVFVSVSRNH